MIDKTPRTEAQVTFGTVTVNYHDVGSGEPIMLIHGAGPGEDAWTTWHAVIAALQDRARLVAPDLIGFGHTEAPHIEFDIDQWVTEILMLADHLDLGTFSIVGRGLGGAISLLLAARHPERVRRLVLVGAASVPFPLTDALDAIWSQTPWLFPAPRQRWVDALAPAPQSMRGIATPTLAIHGRNDNVVPLTASYEAVSLMPNARLEIIDDCGHSVVAERPEELCALIAGFVLDEGRGE